MKRAALWMVLALVGLSVGCEEDSGPPSDMEVADNDGPGATETNGFPAMCDDDGDCPEGVTCAKASADGPGFCDINEMVVAGNGPGPDTSDSGDGMSVSLGAPAMCQGPNDCPAGIECVMPDGPGGIGYCNVDEMQAP